MIAVRRILVGDASVDELADIDRAARKAGFDPLLTSFGAQVLLLAEHFKPQLIVLNIKFPDADGRDVLAQLKRDPRTREIPVVMVSQRDYETDRSIAVDLGAAEYLPKSDAAALMRIISSILSSA